VEQLRALLRDDPEAFGREIHRFLETCSVGETRMFWMEMTEFFPQAKRRPQR